MLLVTTWMDLKNIMLSEISQMEKDIHSYAGYKRNQETKQNKQTQSQITVWWLSEGKGVGEG